MSYTAEADGNYTLPLVKTEFVVYSVFRTPQERYEVEAPPATRSMYTSRSTTTAKLSKPFRELRTCIPTPCYTPGTSF